MISTNPAAANVTAVDLCKRYGNTSALNHVSLDVLAGEFLTLLGPSGSGKTTLLMTLAGFVEPDCGTLSLNGVDITNRTAEARGFGMVFQGYALFPHLTVAENVAFALRIRKVDARERIRRVNELLDLVGLIEHRDKRPQNLSGGQQQRVALARALVYSPPLILLDEPFSALDKNLKNQLHDEIRRIHREVGTTFIFVSHDQAEALTLSDRIAIFDHGRLLQIGEPRVLYEQPINKFCAEFLGDINLFPLQNASCSGGELSGLFEDRMLAAPYCDVHPPSQPCVGVRPEYTVLTSGQAPQQNAVPVEIEVASYEGARTKLILRSRSGFKFVHQIPSDTQILKAHDESLWLSWSGEKSFVV